MKKAIHDNPGKDVVAFDHLDESVRCLSVLTYGGRDGRDGRGRKVELRGGAGLGLGGGGGSGEVSLAYDRWAADRRSDLLS